MLFVNVELRGAPLSLIGLGHHPTNVIARHFSIITAFEFKSFWKLNFFGTSELVLIDIFLILIKSAID